jgi:choline dehydrogenase-like flavoprotein
VTATVFAEAGASVLVVEEGEWVEPGECPPFSMEQMLRQYRGAGLTAALGRPSVSYAEGRCAGGGSEVNSGLYHRPSADLLARWALGWSIEGLDPPEVWTWSDRVESDLDVSLMPHTPPRDSVALQTGAAALGWDAREVPRWVLFPAGTGLMKRNSMTQTYLPRARRAGAELWTNSRAVRVRGRAGRIEEVLVRRGGVKRPERVLAGAVVVAAGAIHTPTLLQRSGIRRHIGATLSVHPTVKAAARFSEEINDPEDVAVHQVKEFAPYLSFGGSASRPPLVALSLAESWERFSDEMLHWQQLGVFYAAIQSKGRGRVIAIPGTEDPLVTYSLTGQDMALLSCGLARLCHLLLAAGADKVLPSFRGAEPITAVTDVSAAADGLTRSTASLMTVHLCGTVPMGEDRDRCAADSFGRLHGWSNLFVNDASLLPEAPGINPQGTVMAIAWRNAVKISNDLGHG